VKAAVKDENRFDNNAERYAEYLETPEGRLRADLTFAQLCDFLSVKPAIKPLRALDLGCGTGSAAVRLARLGIEVTLLDSSPAMLDLARRKIVDAGVSNKITIHQGDAGHLTEMFESESFDIVLCHNVLEYVDDPDAVLRNAEHVMSGATAILSVLVRNQAGEALKAALQAGDLVAAEQNLNAEWGHESLYGGKIRLFTPAALELTLKNASLRIIARRGVRVVSDYLPAKISRSAEYERIFSLERKLSQRQEFFGVGRYIQCLARSAVHASEVHE
jgi:S-adenosylmethionine-dependent methyltransferase